MFKKCPYCNGEAIHPIKLLIIRGQSWHKFTCEGVTEGVDSPVGSDSVIIEKTYCCETCACQWAEREESSHGRILVDRVQLPVDPEYSNKAI